MKKRTLLRSNIVLALVLIFIIGGNAQALSQLTIYLPVAVNETPETPSPTTPPPGPTETPSNCHPSYPDPGVCIPPPLPDLDCKDIPYKRFTVLPPDPHTFDGDHDGIGCESG